MFVKNHLRCGIVPRMLEEILRTRVQVKARMKKMKTKNSPEYRTLDAQQSALKMIANTTYGYIAASFSGRMPCVDVADAIVQYGRETMEKSIEMINNEYKDVWRGKVVYGDSILGDTPVITRHRGLIRVCRVDELFPIGGGTRATWLNYHEGKRCHCPRGLEVWQDGGFVHVLKVIRHVCNTPMVRVVTSHGMVDATVDHSLLRPDGSCMSPSESHVGDHLLHALDTELIQSLRAACDKEIPVSQRWIVSLTSKILFSASSTTESRNHLESTPFGVTRRFMCQFYNKHGEKTIPSFVFSLCQTDMDLFWWTYWNMHGCLKDAHQLHVVESGKELCTGLWLIGRILGWTCHMDLPMHLKNGGGDTSTFSSSSSQRTYIDEHILSMTFTAESTSHLIPDDRIRYLVPLSHKTLHSEVDVYDLETSSGHFHVGPGNLVVHNTDSLFVLLEGRSVADAFDVGLEMAKTITSRNPTPMKLELEYIFCPCILVSKKRYVGYAFEDKGSTPSLLAKGIETVRRDSCEIVEKTMKKVLKTLFTTSSLTQVRNLMDDIFGRIMRFDISLDLSQFVLRKKVRLGYYKGNAPPGAILSLKAMKTDLRAAPLYSEHVPYLVVTGGPKSRLRDRVIDPLEIRDGHILDGTYYVQKQILPALDRLFGTFSVDIRKWFSGVRTSPSIDDWRSLTTTIAPESGSATGKGHLTIESYYALAKCTVCGNIVRRISQTMQSTICPACQADAYAHTVIEHRRRVLESSFTDLEMRCCTCCDVEDLWNAPCCSANCEVLFQKAMVLRLLENVTEVLNYCASEKSMQ
jgi:hypothetical protein